MTDTTSPTVQMRALTPSDVVTLQIGAPLVFIDREFGDVRMAQVTKIDRQHQHIYTGEYMVYHYNGTRVENYEAGTEWEDVHETPELYLPFAHRVFPTPDDAAKALDAYVRSK